MRLGTAFVYLPVCLQGADFVVNGHRPPLFQLFGAIKGFQGSRRVGDLAC